MDAIDFKKLNFEQREDLVLEYGQFITMRQYEDYNILLFAVNKIYCEIWCVYNTFKVVKINPVTDNNVLDLYLENVSLDEIFNVLH